MSDELFVRQILELDLVQLKTSLNVCKESSDLGVLKDLENRILSIAVLQSQIYNLDIWIKYYRNTIENPSPVFPTRDRLESARAELSMVYSSIYHYEIEIFNGHVRIRYKLNQLFEVIAKTIELDARMKFDPSMTSTSYSELKLQYLSEHQKLHEEISSVRTALETLLQRYISSLDRRDMIKSYLERASLLICMTTGDSYVLLQCKQEELSVMIKRFQEELAEFTKRFVAFSKVEVANI